MPWQIKPIYSRAPSSTSCVTMAHHIGIDFIGPISPASHQGNRYILTITDYFTNFVEAIPMKRKYFENVAAASFKVVKLCTMMKS